MDLSNLTAVERQAITDENAELLRSLIEVRQQKENYLQNEKKRIRDINQTLLGGHEQTKLPRDIQNVLSFNNEHNSYLEMMRKNNIAGRKTLRLYLRQIENNKAA